MRGLGGRVPVRVDGAHAQVVDEGRTVAFVVEQRRVGGVGRGRREIRGSSMLMLSETSRALWSRRPAGLRATVPPSAAAA